MVNIKLLIRLWMVIIVMHCISSSFDDTEDTDDTSYSTGEQIVIDCMEYCIHCHPSGPWHRFCEDDVIIGCRCIYAPSCMHKLTYYAKMFEEIWDSTVNAIWVTVDFFIFIIIYMCSTCLDMVEKIIEDYMRCAEHFRNGLIKLSAFTTRTLAEFLLSTIDGFFEILHCFNEHQMMFVDYVGKCITACFTHSTMYFAELISSVIERFVEDVNYIIEVHMVVANFLYDYTISCFTFAAETKEKLLSTDFWKSSIVSLNVFMHRIYNHLY